MTIDDYQRFVPRRVCGLPDVTEVIVRPSRVEFRSAGRWVSFRFAHIARWARPRSVWRLLARVGWISTAVPVGDRDWCLCAPDRPFRFYTVPPVVVCMPADEPEAPGGSCFIRVQEVLLAGGFCAVDSRSKAPALE